MLGLYVYVCWVLDIGWLNEKKDRKEEKEEKKNEFSFMCLNVQGVESRGIVNALEIIEIFRTNDH